MNQSEEHSISIQEQKSKIRERYRGVDPDTLECLPARPPENIYDEDRELRVAVYLSADGYLLCRQWQTSRSSQEPSAADRNLPSHF